MLDKAMIKLKKLRLSEFDRLVAVYLRPILFIFFFFGVYATYFLI